jgi:hypothetical protein
VRRRRARSGKPPWKNASGKQRLSAKKSKGGMQKHGSGSWDLRVLHRLQNPGIVHKVATTRGSEEGDSKVERDEASQTLLRNLLLSPVPALSCLIPRTWAGD